MPEVVVDTSVFIAGVLTENPSLSSPAHIIQLWKRGAFTLVMSPQILQELVAKLTDKGVSEETITDLVKSIAKTAMHIPGACKSTKLDTTDSSDSKFLAAAYESGADYIVSIDMKSLLPLKHFHDTQIRTPDLFIRALMGLTEEEASDEA